MRRLPYIHLILYELIVIKLYHVNVIGVADPVSATRMTTSVGLLASPSKRVLVFSLESQLNGLTLMQTR